MLTHRLRPADCSRWPTTTLWLPPLAPMSDELSDWTQIDPTRGHKMASLESVVYRCVCMCVWERAEPWMRVNHRAWSGPGQSSRVASEEKRRPRVVCDDGLKTRLVIGQVRAAAACTLQSGQVVTNHRAVGRPPLCSCVSVLLLKNLMIYDVTERDRQTDKMAGGWRCEQSKQWPL